MTNLTFKLFNFLGAPVKLNLLFLILFAFLSIPIAASVFVAVLIHEMAHAYVAHKKGYQVYGIEIGLFNGSAAMSAHIHERDSIPITGAGPASNLILYLLALGLGTVVSNEWISAFAIVNLFLFIFNILPIYPMDGGKILKDLLYLHRKKLKIDRRRAADIADYTSLITSGLLAVFSVITGHLFMLIFAVYFGYLALKSLGHIK